MTYYSYNDYLIHHGIKGMKWGVRHDYEPTGRRRASSKSAYKRNHKGNAKKWVKHGAIAAGMILGAAGAAYLIRSGKVDKLVKLGKNKVAPILENPDLFTITKKDGLKYINNFNVNFNPKASNCRQATSEFLCKKAGINCMAKPAEVNGNKVKTGADPHDLFPNSLISEDIIPKKALKSEQEFNAFLENRFKTLCEGKDGFGSMTINLKKSMRHNLSWEIKDGVFNIIDADGAINRSYYSTFKNNLDNGFNRGRQIEFFRAVGDIDMNAVRRQVIMK